MLRKEPSWPVWAFRCAAAITASIYLSSGGTNARLALPIMQNRYVGDLGDFGKFGLLRALCSCSETGNGSGDVSRGGLVLGA